MKSRVLGTLGLLSLAACFAYSQDVPSGGTVVQQTCPYSCNMANQEIRIANLPSLTAPSTHTSAALPTALEIIFRDKDVCCGRDSALVDQIPPTHGLSLKELAIKLQGRHLLSDGRPIMVTADYVSGDSTSPGKIISPLHDGHPLLMQWESHFYVVYGVVFDEGQTGNGTDTGGVFFSIRKLLLVDPRFSDERREAVFNRDSDDWTKVQGLLMVTAAAQ